ncbi:twin-arginine translocase TatA/TatE family subunit, partial [bacterium]
MFGIGWGELILIFLVILLLFGAKKLPEIGRALGKGIREFKRSIKEIE